jgi:hypothetical protein
MANIVTPAVFFRGAATTTLTTTLYTVPASTTAIVSSIAVTNTTGTAQTFDIALDGVKLHASTPIGANTTLYIDLKQPLATTKIIAGGASAATVNFHIAGITVT